MAGVRFSYNPFTKDYIESGCSHAIALYNRGKQKQFDEYIRGIILDDVLYLRTYYPFENLAELSKVELHQKSRELLEQYKDDILARVDKVKKVCYNVENDLLKGIGLANI